MKLYMTAAPCKQVHQVQVQPLVNFQGGSINQVGINVDTFFRRKDKVVFVVGATGTGKSRLAIDLATRFPAEIINSDKMQVYRDLEITTNKVTEDECRGVPHHLLGNVADPQSNFSAADFCHHASSAIESILSRDRLPIIAGGSNSFIDALINDHHNHRRPQFRLRYDICVLWVDLSLPVLHGFVSERVDRMVANGLVGEVRRIFDPTADYSRGIRRAIGVPELDKYFRAELRGDSEKNKARLLRYAIDEIKKNTCVLACRQLQKINRFHENWRWNTHRLEATEAFLKRGQGLEAGDAWEKLVAGPATMIVDDFLYSEGLASMVPNDAVLTTAPVSLASVVAAVTR
ncbi:hypothetical protein CsatB_026076 [Cannabis sativa]|uniref:adenylate dimethylallyltransferase (ADP/ATP-dependent) n=2 Tax=Cannabis sativa TaxID=3483 RepID=A0A7J6EKB6_CANSA|nr:adenylate isopentenyltransferase 5, chloroplastic [Cannabis sativa]KAF4358727.1 hypothetical protein G4B88_015078 [Cannabis sativa]KAF4358892.1 hypothetical protein F8388_013696 [Cannabis sativa]KAF4378837.1 hypothetical protein G4B88_008307 [Cannabis sativa]